MTSPTISFEFFPPKTDKGRENLIATREALGVLNPEYFSVTYGAGGSTREFTRDTVLSIRDAHFAVAPHLSFGGDSEETVLDLLNQYVAAGINRVVALRGDLPSGMGGVRLVYASELVAFIRQHFGSHFTIAVACYPEIHPEARDYGSDIGFLKAKFDAGANFGITQYFYNVEAYFYFLDQCEAAGISQLIYPGIMPITNVTNLLRFSDNCGAEIPRWMRKRFDQYRDDEASLLAFGEEVVTHLCEQLLDGGAPGFHFYTMNQSAPTLALCRNLGFTA